MFDARICKASASVMMKQLSEDHISSVLFLWSPHHQCPGRMSGRDNSSHQKGKQETFVK